MQQIGLLGDFPEQGTSFLADRAKMETGTGSEVNTAGPLSGTLPEDRDRPGEDDRVMLYITISINKVLLGVRDMTASHL